MSIMARYSGVCPECGERWQPGDFIRSDYRDIAGAPVWLHVACPDAAPEPIEGPACPVCWLRHPEGACDRD